MALEREHGRVSYNEDRLVADFLHCCIVITGATDGIGREFALQLGKAGFNVFMASRSEAKLETLASEIRQCFSGFFVSDDSMVYPGSIGVESRFYAIDFAEKGNEESWQGLFVALSSLNIGVLGISKQILLFLPFIFIFIKHLPSQ